MLSSSECLAVSISPGVDCEAACCHRYRVRVSRSRSWVPLGSARRGTLLASRLFLSRPRQRSLVATSRQNAAPAEGASSSLSAPHGSRDIVETGGERLVILSVGSRSMWVCLIRESAFWNTLRVSAFLVREVMMLAFMLLDFLFTYLLTC